MRSRLGKLILLQLAIIVLFFNTKLLYLKEKTTVGVGNQVEIREEMQKSNGPSSRELESRLQGLEQGVFALEKNLTNLKTILLNTSFVPGSQTGRNNKKITQNPQEKTESARILPQTTQKLSGIPPQKPDSAKKDEITARTEDGHVAQVTEPLVHVYRNGTVQFINRAKLIDHLTKSLWRWDYKTEVLAFMHIGKNGGTSLRGSLTSATHDLGCRIRSVGYESIPQHKNTTCPGEILCACSKHYDWTAISKMEAKGAKVAVVSTLRNPVDRAVSHYYFSQGLSWTANRQIRKEPLEQYFQDYEAMLDTRDIWQDGQAGVSWFSGTHIANWVVPLTPEERTEREEILLDWSRVLNAALKNFHQSLWVGILEKMDQSLELLHYQSGFRVRMRHTNKTKKKDGVASAALREKLTKLTPLDTWFYTYGSLFHDAKWNLYKMMTSSQNITSLEFRRTVTSLADDIIAKAPKLISGCISSRFILSCPQDKVYYHRRVDDESINAQQRALLPKTWS